ncbi:MAG TPA: HNH endonuclease [Fluviicoccus sp.]|nr:HNH endonuclease [Fluviicoccus sp.]
MEAIISGLKVLIDDCDAHLLDMGAWRVVDKPRCRYAKLNKTVDGKKVTFYLHRLVAGAGNGQTVDHINGDTLDCRRVNLRLVGRRENCRNRINKAPSTSRFKGVSFDSTAGKWRMQIRIDGKRITVRYSREAEAAFHYDMLSLQHHGSHGARNFLPLV